jgi:hypothetical protein
LGDIATVSKVPKVNTISRKREKKPPSWDEVEREQSVIKAREGCLARESIVTVEQRFAFLTIVLLERL